MLSRRGEHVDEVSYDLGGEESAPKPRRPGLPVEPRRLWHLVRPHSRRVGRVFLVTLLLAVVGFSLAPRDYVSDAVLLYEGSSFLPSNRHTESPMAFVQSAIVPSRLRQARAALGWEVPLKTLEERVSASLDSEASMRIRATGPTAEEAFELANAVLDVFLSDQVAFQQKELDRLASDTAVSLENAHARRKVAQAEFDAFRDASGKPDLLDEREQLLKRAAALRAREDEAAVEAAAQSALIRELERARNELPRQVVASATKTSAVGAPLAKARADLAQARSTLSEQHPRVRALKQRVANLEAQLGTQRPEIGAQTLVANPALTSVEEQLATAKAAYAAAEERRAAVDVLLANIQREAETLAPAEGEARQVIAELDAAIARVEELTARGAALRDASRDPSSGFRVLSAPVIPEEASRDVVAVTFLVLLPPFVVAFVVIVLLVRGLRELRVEAPREVAWWGNGPVLGTTVWPRDPDALAPFVDELEDQGVYGAGRTLVVPATEAERDIACSFAMRLADAPWLAAAILDIGERAASEPAIVTPPPDAYSPHITPKPERMRRLSSEGTPAVAHGRVVHHKPTMQGFEPPSESRSAPSSTPLVTPAPEAGEGTQSWSSRPPRKRTVIGLPAVRPSNDAPPATPSTEVSAGVPASGSAVPAGAQPFQRKRGARATVRMVVPGPKPEGGSLSDPANAGSEAAHRDEDAFLLTRPVPVVGEEEQPVGRAVHVRTEAPEPSPSNAVMRAAVRLLGDEEEDITDLRRSQPPAERTSQEVVAVALAWNGPLSGPVLRRAARLSHRVMVVVSSGLSVVELARIKTRLGRDGGVGYVLVNLEDTYLDTDDRVGPVEEFWQGARESERSDPRLP